jgi:hypothetical protein
MIMQPLKKTSAYLISALFAGLVLGMTTTFAETTQEQDMGFKSKDADSMIKETAEPDPSAVKPDPGADPTAFKSKDTDSMIKETHTPDPKAAEPNSGAEPAEFQDKEHVGLEPVGKTE